MDEDPRGMERGACMAPDCDCTAYERTTDKAPCDHCSCPPTKHKKKYVIVTTSTDDENTLSSIPSASHSFSSESIILSESSSLDSSSSRSFEAQYTLPIDSHDDGDGSTIKILACVMNQTQGETSKVPSPTKLQRLPPQSSETDDDENASPSLKTSKSSRKASAALKKGIEELANRKENIISCFPKTWPNPIEECIAERREFNDKIFNLLIRTLVDRLKKNNLIEIADFDIAAGVAYDRYDFLRSNVSTSSAYLSALMRRCSINKKHYEMRVIKSKEKSSSTDSPSLSNNSRELKDIQDLMNEEMQKPNPSIVALKDYLKSCRLQKVADSKTSNADIHLKKFPALMKSDLLLWEFSQVFHVDPKLMRLRWIQATTKLENYFSQTHVIDEDVRTIILLKLISNQFNRKNKDAFESIVTVYDENTPIQDTVPSGDAAPRMIGIGSIEKDELNFVIYVDKVPLHTGTAVNSLIFLFASYWIFNISFPSITKMTFTFLAAILFQVQYYDDFKEKRSIVKLIEGTNLFELPK